MINGIIPRIASIYFFIKLSDIWITLHTYLGVFINVRTLFWLIKQISYIFIFEKKSYIASFFISSFLDIYIENLHLSTFFFKRKWLTIEKYYLLTSDPLSVKPSAKTMVSLSLWRKDKAKNNKSWAINANQI